MNRPPPQAGRFISFEGGEGAGKSTQIALLSEALNARGIAHRVTREPGGTPGAEALRDLLLDHAQDWDARSEALLFAAARADHVANHICPALAAGEWVLCDRFIDSSRAYQGGAGGLSDDDIMALHAVGCNGLLPDRTVLLDLDPQAASVRAARRDHAGADRIGGKDAAYHARVRARFAELAAREPARFVTISGEGEPRAVHDRVVAAISDLWVAA